MNIEDAQVFMIVRPATEKDARTIGQTFYSKITTKTEFKILVIVRDGITAYSQDHAQPGRHQRACPCEGKDCGFIVEPFGWVDNDRDFHYPFVWNASRFVAK